MRTLWAFLEFAELLHLFLMELVELVQLFLGKNVCEGGHTVDAMFQQCLVGFENLCLGGIDLGLVGAFKSFAQSLFGFVLVLAEILENGIALGAASFDGGLLFRRHLQQRIDDFEVRALESLRTMTLEITLRAVAVMAVLCAVRAMAGLSVFFARAGLSLYAVAGSARSVHCAVFAGHAAFLAAGHFCLLAATAASDVEVTQEESQGEGKDCNTCREEFVSVHSVTP